MAFRQTIREQIISAVESALSNILTANGYETEIGSDVRRGQKIEEKGRLPAIGFFPLTETNVQKQGKNELTFDIRVEAVHKYGSKNPSVVAEAMLGDLIRCLTSDPESITRLADAIQYNEGGVEDYPEAQEFSVGCYAIFRVLYKTVKGDPFIQNRNLTIQQSETLSINENVQT